MSDDFIAAERKWSRQEAERIDKRDESRREHRTDRIKSVTTGLVVVLVVAIIGLVIWRVNLDNQERSTRREVEHERTITACTTAGGSWVSINGGDYTCLHIGAPQ